MPDLTLLEKVTNRIKEMRETSEYYQQAILFEVSEELSIKMKKMNKHDVARLTGLTVKQLDSILNDQYKSLTFIELADIMFKLGYEIDKIKFKKIKKEV